MTNFKRRVFVVEAHMPNGGTYMAYHLGAIVHQHWGYDPVAVSARPGVRSHDVWEYDVPFREVGITDLCELATADDMLIANPSFSDHLFGLTFPGKKLMYVQGMNSFAILDGFFDKYVAVSPFVQRCLLDTYHIDAPVIEPFVHHDHTPQPTPPWEDRPEGSVATFVKQRNERLFDHFQRELSRLHPNLAYRITRIPRGIAHREFLRLLSQNRYYLAFSPVEGFGLPPLEAMLCGCVAVGFDGGGGSAYFEHNRNALISSYPDLARLIELFHIALSQPSLAAKMVASGLRTAKRYTFHRFRQCWIDELTLLLGPPTVAKLT